MAAPGVGFLGGYAGVFGAFTVSAPAMVKKFPQKTCPAWKNTLLFLPEMLYNGT
jgi:uncharacterized membrane protein YfcA